MSIFKEMGFLPAQENINEAVIYSIGKTYSVLAKYFNQEYKIFGLNPTKVNVLIVAKHIGKTEGIRQNEIGSKLVVSEANITKVIDSLEKKGLVLREAKPGDRRANLIKITKKGSELLDKVWVNHLKLVDKLTRSLNEREKRLLEGLLSKIRTGVKEEGQDE